MISNLFFQSGGQVPHSYMVNLSHGVVKVFPVFIAVFALILPPALYSYGKANGEVYYDIGHCLPEDMEYVAAEHKLRTKFDIASTHMVLVDTALSSKDVRDMTCEMEQVAGVNTYWAWNPS